MEIHASVSRFRFGGSILNTYRTLWMTSLDRFRRILGVAFLGLAGVFLIVGLTWLAPVLEGVRFLVYWMVPLLATLAALVCAIVDIIVLRCRHRREQEEMAKSVFGKRRK